MKSNVIRCHQTEFNAIPLTFHRQFMASAVHMPIEAPAHTIFFQQGQLSFLANAGDIVQYGFLHAAGTKTPMILNGKAMNLFLNGWDPSGQTGNHLQGMFLVLENKGPAAMVIVLGHTSNRNGKLHGSHHSLRSTYLILAPIHEDQIRQRHTAGIPRKTSPKAPIEHFLKAGSIVRSFHRMDPETTIGFLFRLARRAGKPIRARKT